MCLAALVLSVLPCYMALAKWMSENEALAAAVFVAAAIALMAFFDFLARRWNRR
jgi:hypothetical protein